MSAGNLIVLAIIALIVGLLFFVVKTSDSKPSDKLGTAPGKGYTKKTIFMNTGAGHGGQPHQFTISHTKDPQEHAQGFIPAKARKKDKTK